MDRMEKFEGEVPCPMMRLIGEKLYFPDNFSMIEPKLQEDFKKLAPRNYFYFTNPVF